MAVFYRDAGRFAEAEPLFQRAIDIDERTYGPEHRDLAWPLNHLGTIYRDTGRLAEAEPLFEGAIAIYERTPRCEHPGLAHCLHHLAVL